MMQYYPLARHYEFVDPEDLAQELSILAWKLRRGGENPRFIPKKLRWYAMDYRRKMRKQRENEVSLSELQAENHPSEIMRMEKMLELISPYLLEAHQKVLTSLSEGYTMRETAKKLGLSKSGVHRIVKEVRAGYLA